MGFIWYKESTVVKVGLALPHQLVMSMCCAAIPVSEKIAGKPRFRGRSIQLDEVGGDISPSWTAGCVAGQSS